MDYKIAIPSYNRPSQLVEKSIRCLFVSGINMDNVTIFVATDEEKARYEEVTSVRIIVGCLGITKIRNYIMNYYPIGENIIMMDDDVEVVVERQDENTLNNVSNLDTLFTECFNEMRERNLHIWGVYPTCNPFFMKDNHTVNLKFIIGTLFGFTNRRMLLDETLAEKEDYDNTIKHYIKDGGVLRFNNISIKTKKHSKGGCGITKDRIQNNINASHILKMQYPELLTVFVRKNGVYEVRLKR
jgi:hypothetical protein